MRPIDEESDLESSFWSFESKIQEKDISSIILLLLWLHNIFAMTLFDLIKVKLICMRLFLIKQTNFIYYLKF